MRLTAGSLVVVLGLGLAGCSSSYSTTSGPADGGQDATSSGESGTDAAVDHSASDTGPEATTEASTDAGFDASPAAVCGAYASAACAFSSQCNPGDFEQYASLPDCVAQLTADCELALAAPGSGEVPAQLEKCAAAQASAKCGDIGVAQPGYPCDFHGTGAGGSSCFFDAQCASSSCVGRQLGNPCGKCTSLGGLGDACQGGTGVSCPVNLTCDNGTCKTLVGPGATCDASNICVKGLSCVLATAGATSGTCTVQGTTASTACNTNRVGEPQCSGAAGLHCAATGRCAADTYVTAGSACDPTTFTSCTASTCVGGTCVAALAAGSACTVGGSPDCVQDVVCVASADAGTPDAATDAASDAAADAGLPPVPGTCTAYAVCQ